MQDLTKELNQVINNIGEARLSDSLNPNSLYDFYKRIIREVAGVEFIVDPSKISTGFHDIRVQELAEFKDLELPDGFSLLRPKTQQSLGALLDYYDQVVKHQRLPDLPEGAEYDSKDAHEAFLYFYKFVAVDFEDREDTRKKDSAEVIAKKMIETVEDDSHIVDNGITIAPCENGVARAFVPPAESFPMSVQMLTAEDILGSVFRDAELDIFTLGLGRTCVGRNNSKDTITGEIFNHLSRLALLVLGKPGVGKTTVQDAIVQALQALGYSTATIPNEGFDHRFVGPKVFTSDLVYKDDMSGKEIENLSKSSNFKSSVTGGRVKAEDKNKDCVEVVPNAASYFNTNKFNDSVFNGSDDGAVDRMNIVTTLDMADLPSLTFNSPVCNEVWQSIPATRRTFGVYLEKLADKLGVEEQTLMFWLFRCSVDYFMTEVRNGTLKATHNRLRAKLDHVSPKDPIIPLITAAQFATRLAGFDVGESLNTRTLLQSFNCLISLHSNMDKKYYDIKNVMKDDWIEHGCPWEHPYSMIKWMTDTSALSMFLTINEKSRGAEDLNEIEKVIKLNKTSKFMELALAETRIGKNNMKVRCSPADLAKFWAEGHRKLSLNVEPLLAKIDEQISPVLEAKWSEKMQLAGYSRQAITEKYEA